MLIKRLSRENYPDENKKIIFCHNTVTHGTEWKHAQNLDTFQINFFLAELVKNSGKPCFYACVKSETFETTLK